MHRLTRRPELPSDLRDSNPSRTSSTRAIPVLRPPTADHRSPHRDDHNDLGIASFIHPAVPALETINLLVDWKQLDSVAVECWAGDRVLGHQVLDDVCLRGREQLVGFPLLDRLQGLPPFTLQGAAQVRFDEQQLIGTHEDSVHPTPDRPRSCGSLPSQLICPIYRKCLVQRSTSEYKVRPINTKPTSCSASPAARPAARPRL